MPEDFGGLRVDRDYAVGSIVGVRAFDPTLQGLLRSVSQDCEWGPTEMRAICNTYVSKDQLPEIEGETHADRQSRIEEWKKTHDRKDCQCGFYAYFAHGGTSLGRYEHNYLMNEPRVTGIVEAYGWVQVGTKGFRAERARIKALAIPAYEGLWRLDEVIEGRIRDTYEGIPIFKSNVAMLSAFPTNVYDDFSDELALSELDAIDALEEL
jgi:hypothetical protein